MVMGLSFVGGLLAVFIVCYVHYEIPKFTKGNANRVVAQVAVVLVGCGFGFVCARVPTVSTAPWVKFAAGFTAVHVPPAVVLFIKYLRHSGRS